jgi:hypothetical protein
MFNANEHIYNWMYYIIAKVTLLVFSFKYIDSFPSICTASLVHVLLPYFVLYMNSISELLLRTSSTIRYCIHFKPSMNSFFSQMLWRFISFLHLRNIYFAPVDLYSFSFDFLALVSDSFFCIFSSFLHRDLDIFCLPFV